MRIPLLHDRVAIITGGSRGIGREIALSYAREGGRVALVARGAEALEAAAAHIRKETGCDVLVFPLDVTDRERLQVMVQEVTARFGRVDILVHAAAIVGPIGPLEVSDPIAWEEAVSVNLLGSYAAARAVLPPMIAQKEGTILLFAGGGAFGARERFSAYSVAKAGVVRLIDCMALELRQYGIAVNGISPGQVNTAMFTEMVAAGRAKVGEKAWAEFQRRLRTGGDPIGRVADLALFLSSAEGRRISGRVISARWDPWESLPQRTEELMASDIYTMRRIVPEDYGKHWE